MSSPDNPQLDAQTPVNTDVPPPPPAETGTPVSAQPPPLVISHADLQALSAPPVPTGPPPVENPVWSGWDVLLIAGLTLVSMFVLQSAVIVGAYFLTRPRVSLSELVQRPSLLLISQLLIYAAVAACMIFLVEGKYHVPFWRAIRWNWPRSEWKFLGLGVILLVALVFLQSFLPIPKDTPFEHLFDNPRDALLLSIIAVTIGPLMEELFFRGFLYPVLARRWGVVWGVLLTALPFGLLHLQQYGWAWALGFLIFLVGVVCGFVRAATKSVAASFLVHMAYNGTQMLILVLETHGFRQMPKASAFFSAL